MRKIEACRPVAKFGFFLLAGGGASHHLWMRIAEALRRLVGCRGGGLLVEWWQRCGEIFEYSGDISGHRDINVAGCIIPVEGEATI